MQYHHSEMDLKMSYKLKSIVISSMLSLVVPTVLVAADANDNYDTAVVEKWVDDDSNKAVELLDIMSCMAGQGGVSRPGFANKSWIALVNEKKCGMDTGEGSNGQEKKATIQFTSSLAAAGSTQEIVGYMEQSNGKKVILNMQIKKSAAALPPYGDWYSSFYFVGDPSKDFANQPSGVFHGYGKVQQVGADVVVNSAYSPGGPGAPSTETKIVYAGGSVADVTYTYKLSGATGDFDTVTNGYYIGKTSANELYTGYVNLSNEFDASRSECKKRDATWKSSWLGALYDPVTKARLKLAAPPFAFTVDSDKSRGQARSENSWMESNELRAKLNPSANTVAVTRSDTNAAVTLQWTPTRMENKNYIDFEPSNQDLFNHGEGHGFAIWDGLDLKWDKHHSGDRDEKILTTTRIWSDFYDSEFLYDGTTSPKTFQMINRKQFKSDDYPAAGTSALYKCYASYNCPHDKTKLGVGNGNINPTFEQYKAVRQASDNDWWHESHGGKDRVHSESDIFHYYLTGITPPTGFLGATLYYDKNQNGLGVEDQPVMFKYNVVNTYNAEASDWKTMYVNHGSTDLTAFEIEAGKTMEARDMWATLIPGTSTCNGGDWHTCADAVDFSARQYVYDHPLIIKNADGTFIDISPVMKMKYTQRTTLDLNHNSGALIELPATFQREEYIEWLDEPCHPGSMPEDLDRDKDPEGNKDTNTCEILIKLEEFNGKTLNVRYDGEMNNLPGYYDRRGKKFYRLINPKDGVKFINLADQKEYLYKALGIDEIFVPTASADACSADVKLTALPTGFSADELPLYTETTLNPRPTQIWATKPAAPSCMLEGDVETNCH